MKKKKPDVPEDITVIGSTHSPPIEELEDVNIEGFLDEDWREELEAEMEENEVFAWEPAGYKEGWGEGTYLNPEGGDFYEEVHELSIQNFDEMVGPDAKEPGFYLACVGLTPLPFGAAVMKGINDERGDDTGLLDATREHLFSEEKKGMSRRETLSLGLSLLPVYLLGVADPLLPDQEESLDKSGSFASAGLDDFREVYIAEGMVQASRNYENGVLGLFGGTHLNSIVNYIEAPEARKEKVERYGELLPDSSKKMTRFERSGDYWELAEVEDIPDRMD